MCGSRVITKSASRTGFHPFRLSVAADRSDPYFPFFAFILFRIIDQYTEDSQPMSRNISWYNRLWRARPVFTALTAGPGGACKHPRGDSAAANMIEWRRMPVKEDRRFANRSGNKA